MTNAEVRHRVDHGVLDGRRRPDRRCLPDALRAEWVERRWRLGGVRLEARQVGRRCNAVVGEVRGEQVAVGVVAHLLVEGLSGAGCDATVLLTLDQHGVQHRSAIVDRDVAQQGDVARVEIDLDHGDVRAEWEGRPALVEDEVGAERLGRSCGELGPGELAGRHAGDADRATGVVDHDVVERRFEQRGRKMLRLDNQRIGRAGDGRATELQRPRATSATTTGYAVGVSIDQRDAIYRNAGLRRDEHRVGRLMALTVRGGPGEHRGRTVSMHLERAVLARPTARGDLDVDRNADAERSTIASRTANLLLGAKRRVADCVGSRVQGQRVPTRVIEVARERAERETIVTEEVPFTKLDRIDAQLVRRLIDDAFDQGSGLGPTRSSIGAHRCGVGDADRDVELDGREVVRALRHSPRAARQERADGGICARVADESDAQARELAG